MRVEKEINKKIKNEERKKKDKKISRSDGWWWGINTDVFRRQVLPTTEKFAFKANARGEREIERGKKRISKKDSSLRSFWRDRTRQQEQKEYIYISKRLNKNLQTSSLNSSTFHHLPFPNRSQKKKKEKK